MERALIHELSAAYVLHALDADGERFFERHLAHCPQCRNGVAAFSATAASLAFAAPPAELPPGLRRRILAAIRAELSSTHGRRTRWTAPVIAIAAAAAVAAVGLGLWAGLTRTGDPSVQAQRSLRLTGADGTLVRNANGEATMIIAALPPAPTGKTYEAWVIDDHSATPAGLFTAGSKTTVVHLTRPVPLGSSVGVSVEPAGGSRRLTQTPLFRSARA